jgi:hypothetical protein
MTMLGVGGFHRRYTARLLAATKPNSRSLRSRRKHKAQGGAGSPAGQPRWGAEAERNPGSREKKFVKARETGDRRRLSEVYRPLARAGGSLKPIYPGFRFASPWALYFRLLRRLIECFN